MKAIFITFLAFWALQAFSAEKLPEPGTWNHVGSERLTHLAQAANSATLIP